MTREVGAITGDLDVETIPAGAGVEVRIAYAGAGEWYTVRGSPFPVGTAAVRQLHHERLSDVRRAFHAAFAFCCNQPK